METGFPNFMHGHLTRGYKCWYLESEINMGAAREGEIVFQYPCCGKKHVIPVSQDSAICSTGKIFTKKPLIYGPEAQQGQIVFSYSESYDEVKVNRVDKDWVSLHDTNMHFITEIGYDNIRISFRMDPLPSNSDSRSAVATLQYKRKKKSPYEPFSLGWGDDEIYYQDVTIYQTRKMPK